jgi:acetyl esterase/lipase
MAPALREAGVPCEVDQYDQTGHTLVFSFPTKARHTRTTVATDTIRDQFERQAVVQRYWADNAVSSTLSFNAETEREETAKLLEEYVPQFKSTSMLAKTSHGYVQAPYEEIDEPTFNELYAQINHKHQLVRGGDIEVDECAGGVCPIR